MPAVLRGDHGLGSLIAVIPGTVDILLVRFQIPHCRIVKMQFPVNLQGAPGKNTISVISLGREYRNSQMFPMHQVFADRMSPVHGPPPGTIGKILIKQMVVSLVVYKAVGVVYPVVRRF